jgi:alginate O-acetyltransferase complex protein AlgI
VIGLAKKLLLANAVGQAADAVFGLSAGELTGPVAWLGVVSYSLQIYFDSFGNCALCKVTFCL